MSEGISVPPRLSSQAAAAATAPVVLTELDSASGPIRYAAPPVQHGGRRRDPLIFTSDHQCGAGQAGTGASRR